MSTSWVGGDIAGLSAMSQSMQIGSAAYGQELVQLDTHVKATAHGGVWDGSGGEQMRASWASTLPVAGKPGELAAQAGGVVADLSEKLAGLESKLYNQAETYSRQGVEIDESGRPKALIVSGMGTVPHAAQARAEATAAYARDRSNILEQAQQHRDEAAAKLSKLTGAPLQEKPTGEEPVNAVIGSHELFGKYGDCGIAIATMLAGNMVVWAKVLKIKKYIEELGGLSQAVELLMKAGNAAERAEALEHAGTALAMLVGELTGVGSIAKACGLL